MDGSSIQGRAITLDAMRGVAVMGILAMNIVAFAMPEFAYVTPLAYGGETLADRIAWFFSFVLIDGKMRGLFSLLFGASMILIIERAEIQGESAAGVHYSRMFWLAVFGLIHYFFIWWGDILFLYAAIGCIAFLFRNWEAEKLVKWAMIIFSMGLLWFGSQYGGLQTLQMLAGQPGASPDLAEQYREISGRLELRLDVDNEIAMFRGGYWPITHARIADYYGLITPVMQSIPETLPLMMIGMASMKSGFITGEWPIADYVRWVKRLIPAGIVLSTLLGAWVALNDYDIITSIAVFLVWGTIPRLILTVGYAAALIVLITQFEGSALVARVAATGQVAFTNYLGTSIVMTTIFYGYGFGLFGYVSRTGLWLFVFGACAVMLLWSKSWLARFRYGPLEWLWRSLARMKLQPLLR